MAQVQIPAKSEVFSIPSCTVCFMRTHTLTLTATSSGRMLVTLMKKYPAVERSRGPPWTAQND